MKGLRIALALNLSIFLLLAGLLKEPASHTETEFIMDTMISVTAYGKNAKAAVQKAFVRIREIDKAFDVFDEESELYALNKAPAQIPIQVSTELYNLLTKALAFGTLTEGSFDATLLPVSQLWNFNSADARVPEPASIQEALQKTGSNQLLSDAENRSVTKLKEGIMLDFGGIAKGYAAEEAIKVLKQAGIKHAYLDLGGNIAVFGGKPLAPLKRLLQGQKSRPFVIGIQTPDAVRGDIIETVRLADGFVVTSGDYERYFTADGKRYHHILDPKTGYPAESGLKSVTVISQSGTEADILATALYVGGTELYEAVASFCDTAIFIDENLTVTTLTN
ncbi:MAG: FAD:protein FMN transferase [Clostridia bacterium]|nr:FAD:protein FMN transferase [Clostridia bacterium]